MNGHVQFGSTFNYNGIIVSEGAVNVPGSLKIGLNTGVVGSDNRSDFGGSVEVN